MVHVLLAVLYTEGASGLLPREIFGMELERLVPIEGVEEQ